MIRHGVWHGGPSYDYGHDWRDGLEKFSSLQEARRCLLERWLYGGSYFDRISLDEDEIMTHHPAQYFSTPGVNRKDCYIDLFDIESGEPYLRLTIGPRGGFRSEKF